MSWNELWNEPTAFVQQSCSIRWQHLLRFRMWPVFSETGETRTRQRRGTKLIVNCLEKGVPALFFSILGFQVSHSSQ